MKCDQELCPFWTGDGCACEVMGIERDPYDRPVFIQGHRHGEPICAWPDCRTYLTREQMAAWHG
jgi:hypothetical protein